MTTAGSALPLFGREPVELVVLDVMGTTVVDRGQVTRALEAALEQHGLDPAAARASDWRGASKREAIRRLVAAGNARGCRAGEVHETFRRLLRDAWLEDGVEALPGTERLFGALHERGLRVALNTGLDRDLTGMVLEALGWQRRVDAIVCGDDVAEGRPKPYLLFRAMEATGATTIRRVASVGDTAYDLAAGHNAGVRWNVGVLSGAHSQRQLAAAPHTHIVGSADALLEECEGDP